MTHKLEPLSYEFVAAKVKNQIDQYNEQWNSGIAYRAFFARFANDIKRTGIAQSDFVLKLGIDGIIKIVYTPGGLRYVFSGSCSLSPDELSSHAGTLERTHLENKARAKNEL